MNENLKNKFHQLIKDHPELKTEFYFQEWETDFLRFYQSQTNYNISKQEIGLYVSIYKDKKNYSFSISNPTVEMVEERFNEALSLIDNLPPDPHFHDIQTDTRIVEADMTFNNIQKLSLEKKTEILNRIADAVKEFHFKIYGTFICNYATNYIINSNGVDKKSVSSPIYFEVKAVSEKTEVTVLEAFGSEDAEKLNVEDLIVSLRNKVKSATNEIVDVEPGEYEVILAPRCIGEYIAYYSWSSLSASALDRKNTLLEGKIGQQVFPEHFTLTDDPTDPYIVKFKYNGEGHCYPKLPIFEKGVFKNFLVNSYYSHKTGLQENGAQADCLVMETGDKDLETMIKSIKRGLYVSSLHYMNFINSKESSLTGLTRDGTFLIEDGKITKVVTNLRFTEKITDIISNITEIENKSYTFPMSENYAAFSINAYRMPHVKVKNFKISSSTKTV